MSRLIFINRFFYPDYSATSQLLTDLCFYLSESLDKETVSIHVITSRMRYEDPQAVLPASALIHGVQVHRVWTSRFGRARLMRRALDYLSFYMSAAWRLFRLARKGDVVVVKTDPPLLAVVLLPILWLRGVRLVNWLQDLFPEVAAQLGVKFARGKIGRLLICLRNVSLKQAAVNVVLGERMLETLLASGIPREQLATIANWADETSIYPVAAADNPLRADWDCANRFVVGYSGNMGRAHEFDTLLDAMEMLANEKDILFLFIGNGAKKTFVQAEVKRRKLENVRFHPYQPKELLKESLSLPDAHLISLLPELEGMIVPSKFYGVCAAGRPGIFIGSARGELALLISAHDCGVQVNPGDVKELVRVIRQFRDNPILTTLQGENARNALSMHFSRKKALGEWRSLLENISLQNSN